MKGVLKKALGATGEVVIVAIEATRLVQEQMDRIQALPSAMIHLGQGLMAAALLQALGDPSEDDRVQVEWLTKGEFGYLYAESLGTARLRGTIGNPQAAAEALGHDLGAGPLRVRRHHQGLVSTGMVESSGRVPTDLVEYLEKSEQRACGSNLSVKIDWDESHPANPFRVKSAHGFIVHILPQENESKKEKLLVQWDMAIRGLGPLSKWNLPADPEKATLGILQQLLHEEHPRELLSQELELYCTCSEDRAERAVALMQSQEVAEPDTAGQPYPAEGHTVRCEFCGTTYKVG